MLDQVAEPPRRPGREPMPAAERSRLLIEAAEQVFLRDGYADANLDEVARLAGMSKRTLYQHFASKAALFEACIAAALAPVHVDHAAEEHDLAESLVAILRATGAHLLSARQVAIFRLVIAEGARTPELAEAFHRVIVSKGASTLQRRIEREMRRGRLRLPDAEAAAKMLFGMALGSAHIKLLLGLKAAPEPQEVERLSRLAVDVFLAGARLPATV
ncbi:TetR/AcrR family transcriptional regulator [Roseomonas stagni]|uniref:TetR/AcrR family transcriptional regulator n=1 Tax=Falsiroseomonas algicola TaxID=2716930 RepID=A0A6M1LJ42_9PROT|nr:TetR/AcrR family transcriptional regulator [Falsiroseomonas algicola]NGM20355.1 TetR/AcrR family transcriptional regulator [Falsiroseomonas algicola]